MPVPDQLSPATTRLRKLPSCNHEIVGRLASLTFLPCDEKAFQLGRRFGSRLGEETLCESLFRESEGTSREAELERRNGKVIYWLGSSAAVASLLVGMLYLWESTPRRAVGFDQLARESRQIQGEITLGQALQALRRR